MLWIDFRIQDTLHPKVLLSDDSFSIRGLLGVGGWFLVSVVLTCSPWLLLPVKKSLHGTLPPTPLSFEVSGLERGSAIYSSS